MKFIANTSKVRRARGRHLLAVCGTTAVVLAALATGIAYATSATTIATTDAVVRTTASTFLPSSGGAEATISSFTLPAGNWVVHADDSAVGLNQTSDVVRCWLVAPGGVHVGHATQVGNGQNFPLVASLSDTIGLKLSTATTVSNTCSHDNSTGGTYWIDADATMTAHKADSLKLITTP